MCCGFQKSLQEPPLFLSIKTVAFNIPVLFQIILPLEALPADLAAERQLWTLVRPLVYHQIVALGESALAVLAYELAFRTHLPAELSAAHVVLNLHYRKHRARLLSGTVMVVNHLVFGNLDDDDDDDGECSELLAASCADPGWLLMVMLQRKI